MTPNHPRQESSDDSSDSSRLERRRAQSRTRQLRYLERKRQYERDLEASVEDLHAEVNGLQLQLHSLRNAEFRPCDCPLSANDSLRPPPTTSNIIQNARDLVNCFRSGFIPANNPPWVPCPSPAQEQIRFVQQAMHPDVSNGELHGPNSILEQWRRYTAFFGSLTLHAQSFSLLPASVGHAACQAQLSLSLVVVSSTFQHVFPHLLQPQHSAMAGRLSGQQLHVPMMLQLRFDALGRVCSYDASLDFVQALRPLLDSYKDVAVVLRDALISTCGHIGRDVQRSSSLTAVSRDVRLQVSFMLSPSY
ncbi:bZIP transcription factor 1 [Phytophthora cinnamomi]|uniref:bZIP transcription factor 1 n=1 Tax=Phytophthora cinnamomi TaxID=4785 RepID=UPI003559F477|nr:bZIP transcription factor 1 [Phytophthora cinnamomi]